MTRFSAILFTLFGLFLFACNDAAKPVNISKAPSQPPPPQAQPPGVDSHGHTEGENAPRISLAEAKQHFDKGTAVFIDTHVKATFDHEHIPGAMNITVQDLPAKVNTIPKGKKIIAYCSWQEEHTSASLVAELQKRGLTDSYALLGGTRAWKSAGYPMNKSKTAPITFN